ncbi:glycosyl hydrolase [Dyadobacter sp. CY323]|uniref:glycosyl hydrolase n=1 Tax=Dyadobacter sp. CY323 TaxID=2907302 RepID=UPI001F2A7156|nr:glycosyl hydrolase [Dyadobacter sp. CY323]MCE6988770.1 glycoside hydrolase [Dyadobacter sp. CY323]
MKRSLLFSIVFLQCAFLSAQDISTAKPWTYWWWMGSEVTKQDISAQLQFFKKSGLGGVHIIPIYGVKGNESASIRFLSPQWLDVMQFTVKEGQRLGLGVDLTTGTGWPFGGPNVTADLAARNMILKDGQMLVNPTNQKVKRAAPGGEGLVLDPFHSDAMSKYLTRFDSAFSSVLNRPRSMYMDSYEAYGANWTNDFLEKFKEMRGYDLDKQFALLIDSTNNAAAELVRIDYHQTLSELLLERYAKPWTKWSKKHGFLTRYQAHGSPGNLLDLYDAADIPETESFGSSRFPIPGVRVDPDYSIDQFGTPNPLAMKFASSAANFSGKKLVSSETGTWLANHFKVSLSQIKPQVDELFVAGINHIFYHGTTYSPEKEAYPGWLFYASTNFGKTSHFADQFHLLNEYVQRCQTLLQNSKPDNDVLVYFPIQDLWATKAKSSGDVHLLEVHHVDRWLLDLPFGKLAQKLWKEGYAFDYVSDLQLRKLSLDKNGLLNSGSTTYKTLLIPSSTYMSAETLNELKRLADAGGKIIFEEKSPSNATGYGNHQQHQQQFDKTLNALIKKGNVRISANLGKDLTSNGVVRETDLAKNGLSFIRKKIRNGGTMYFITNLGDQFNEGWLRLGTTGTFSKDDPMTGESLLSYRKGKKGNEFFLSLPPGKSVFLQDGADASEFLFTDEPEKYFEISGDWKLKFLNGKPTLPADAKFSKLQSWASLPDSAEYFSGTASYSLRFDVPEDVFRNAKMLDLGDVRETAKVKLNGREIGTAWCIPYQLPLYSEILKQKDNILEIEVTNLSANYMRLRDKLTPDWKKFKDINIVDITYKKFDALKWEPMPSGLLGPIRFIYY